MYASFTETTQVMTDLNDTGKTLNFGFHYPSPLVAYHSIITRIMLFHKLYKYLCLGFGKGNIITYPTVSIVDKPLKLIQEIHSQSEAALT